MSAISSTSLGQGLFQFSQAIQQNAPTTQAAQANVSGDQTSSTSTQGVQGSGHHHHGGHGGFSKKIEDAVTSALQSSQSSDSSDPNQAIQDAIAQVLSGGATGQTAANSSSTSTPASATSTDAQTNSTATGDKSAFLQTLQSYGIDPQQFRQDFLAALQSVNGDQTGASGTSASLPAGALVDQTA